MTTLAFLAAILLLVAGSVLLVWQKFSTLPAKKKKALLKSTVNGVFIRLEKSGWLPRTPAFDRDYLQSYPALSRLEENYPAVRDECLALLDIKEKLTDMQAMGGTYTQAGIHTAQWKTFVFKSGKFIDENCSLCPKTAAILKQVPGLYTAFFSVLDPHQQITPHWGYYKGFLRYHLGVLIPRNNADRSCFLRVNSDLHDNEQRDPELVQKGETYYWKNGEGIVFDDNYLHDAGNGSDEIRVVLWLDLRRKMPFYLQPFNMLCLAIAHRDKSVKKIRKNAIVAP